MIISRRKFLEYTGLGLGSIIFLDTTMANNGIDSDITLVVSKVKKKYSSSHLQVLYPKGSLLNIQGLAKKFESLTGVNINLKEASLNQISSELILEGKTSKTLDVSDVAIPATFTIPDLAEAGVIADLTQYAKEHERIDFFHDQLYSQGDNYKGRFYGYQADGDTYLLFLNNQMLRNVEQQKKYFDLFGRKLNVPTTWQELDRQIKFFHKPSQNVYGGSLFRNKEYIHWEFWLRMHSKGVLPVNSKFKSRLADRACIESLDEMIQTTKHLEPAVKSNGLFQNFGSFLEGNKFCNLGWGGTQKFLKANSKAGQKFLFALPPGELNSPMSYFNWGWNFVVSSRSQRKELAYLFTLFASLEKSSTHAVSEVGGYFDPHRSSHYQDKRIQDNYGHDFLKVHRETFDLCIPDFYVQGQSQYFASLKSAILAADNSIMSPKKALNLASVEWDKITDKLGAEKQAKQWSFLRSSYPKGFKSGA